jgi:hypothetical protein
MLKVMEWVIVVKCQMSHFSAISWPEQITFWWGDDDYIHFVPDQLDQHAMLHFYSSLKQQGPGGSMS